MIDALIENKIVPGINTALTALKCDVKEHAGKFTWEELEARRYKCPAVFVSCLGWRNLRAEEATSLALPLDGIAPSRVRFVCGVVTKGVKRWEQRNKQARLICQTISQLLYENDWTEDNVGEAQDIQAEALFAPKAEADQQSMWLVSWWHPMVFDRESLQAQLDDFITAHGDLYAAPGEHTDAEGDDIPLASLTETLPHE